MRRLMLILLIAAAAIAAGDWAVDWLRSARAPSSAGREVRAVSRREPARWERVVGAEYVAGLRSLAPDAVRITDKMPGNFLYLGLIHSTYRVDVIAEPEPVQGGPRSQYWRDTFRYLPRTIVIKARKEGN